MSTYSNHVPSGVAEVIRYNYQSNVDGATLQSSTTFALSNPNGANAIVPVYLTLNSGDTSGNNNSVGWRGDGKNADVLLEQRPLFFPPGDFAIDVASFFDGIYSGYGVLSVWMVCTNFSNLTALYVRNRVQMVKA